MVAGQLESGMSEPWQKKSARTLNHYLQAMVSFLNWLERVGRIKVNPLKFVGKIDERGQSKRIRRAFTDDELRRLVAGFHALRYTWATFLQRHGIAQRFAMKLLRHSDIKLTSKVYTDES